jgi:hypothetical protein
VHERSARQNTALRRLTAGSAGGRGRAGGGACRRARAAHACGRRVRAQRRRARAQARQVGVAGGGELAKLTQLREEAGELAAADERRFRALSRATERELLQARRRRGPPARGCWPQCSTVPPPPRASLEARAFAPIAIAACRFLTR